MVTMRTFFGIVTCEIKKGDLNSECNSNEYSLAALNALRACVDEKCFNPGFLLSYCDIPLYASLLWCARVLEK